MRIKGTTHIFRGPHARNRPYRVLLCPNRRPPRPQHPIFNVCHRSGLRFRRRTAPSCDLIASNRGMTPSKPPTRRRHAAKELRMAQNPHRHRSGGCRIAYKNGTVSVGATKLAQQQPRRAASVQNSPFSPEMAQFGAIYACRESFVPLSPPRTQAGRILYRTQGRVEASHDTTTGTTSAEGTGATTGTRRMTGGRTLRHPEHPWGHTAQHSRV